MFESLKQQQRGMSGRERTRLFLSLAAALVLAPVVFGRVLQGLTSDDHHPLVVASGPAIGGATRDLDAAPLAALREGRVAEADLDVAAMRHVLGEVALDRVMRRGPRPKDRAELERLRFLSTRPTLVGGPKDVAAADARASVGALVEVRGVVRAFDPQGFELPAFGAGRRLWSFLLEGPDGARVAVVDAEVPRDRRAPVVDARALAQSGATAPRERPPLDEGTAVHVRGYYLQRFVGAIGPVALDRPTVVLVGREYRPAVEAPPAPASLDAIVPTIETDRTRQDTWSVDDLSHYMTLHWAQAQGHDALAWALHDEKLPWTRWARDDFRRWLDDLRIDRPDADGRFAATDPRAWTNAARGKVFLLSGVLADVEAEDWGQVGDNAYDVSRRWVYRLISDHHVADALIRFDSPFPPETFPGVAAPNPEHPQRVRLLGVFLRNYTYAPAGPSDPAARAQFEKREDRDVTVPSFVLLHIEPDPIRGPGPLLENPFFWSWVVLLALGAVFFVVMRRIDRREAATGRVREQRLRRHVFETSRRPTDAPAPPSAPVEGAVPDEDGPPA